MRALAREIGQWSQSLTPRVRKWIHMLFIFAKVDTGNDIRSSSNRLDGTPWKTTSTFSN
jgi:hypothetical protein